MKGKIEIKQTVNQRRGGYRDPLRATHPFAALFLTVPSLCRHCAVTVSSLCRHCAVRYTSLLLFLLAAALLHALPAVYPSLLIGAVLFVLYGTMVLWYYGIMVLWYYGIMVLWFCLMCRYFRAYSLTLEPRVFQFQYILKQMAYDTCHWCIALYLAYLLAQVCAGFQTNPNQPQPTPTHK